MPILSDCWEVPSETPQLAQLRILKTSGLEFSSPHQTLSFLETGTESPLLTSSESTLNEVNVSDPKANPKSLGQAVPHLVES